MPAQQLPSPGTSPLLLRKFAVAAVYGEQSYVVHVGLVKDPRSCLRGSVVRLYHMGPPLRAGIATIHAAGWLDDLAEDEAAAMELWVVEEIERWQAYWTQDLADAELARDRLRGYIIHPYAIDELDPVSGRTKARRYSCVGFVVMAYREGCGIELIDDSDLPKLTPEDASKVFPASLIAEFQARLASESPLCPVDDARCLYPAAVLHALRHPTPRTQRHKPTLPESLAFE